MVLATLDLVVEMLDWESQHESRVHSFSRVHIDAPAQLDREILRNVQTKSDSFLVDWLVALHDFAKELEQTLLVLLADADTSVVDLELNCILVPDGFAVFDNDQFR